MRSTLLLIVLVAGVSSSIVYGKIEEWNTLYSGVCTLTPEDIDFGPFTHISVIQAEYNVTTDTVEQATRETETVDIYNRLMNAAKRQKSSVKFLISIFGYSEESRALITGLATDDALLDRFSESILQYSIDNKFDGIEVAWPWIANDGPIALRVILAFRTKLDALNSDHLLTITSNSDPVYLQSNLTEIQQYLNFVVVDSAIYGSFSVGSDGVMALSPISDVKRLILDYLKLIPAGRIVMNMYNYGFSYNLTDPTKNTPGSPGITSNSGCYSEPGQISAAEIRLIQEDPSTVSMYDSRNQIFYLLNGNKWISFENNRTMSDKLTYFTSKGLAGVSISPIGQNSDIPNFVSQYYQSLVVAPPVATLAAKSESGGNTGTIIGAVVGGVCGIALISVILFIILRRKPKSQKPTSEIAATKDVTYQPFSLEQPAQKQFLDKFITQDMIDQSDIYLGEQIGSGAGGVVYRGKWRGAAVAVKTFHAESEKHTQECLREVEIMKNLRPHTNVVQYLGICIVKEHGTIYIVTQLCEGGSLYSMLHSNMQIDKIVIEEIVKGVAAGMIHLHTEGIIHRDLAARNILLDKSLAGKVSDFGLSRQNAEGGEAQTSSLVGPLKHMAPECLRSSVYSEKSDVWAFGVTLYEIFTRKDPYENYSPLETATRVTADVEPLRLTPPPQMSVHMQRIFSTCLHTDPKERPNFLQLLSHLEECTSFFS